MTVIGERFGGLVGEDDLEFLLEILLGELPEDFSRTLGPKKAKERRDFSLRSPTRSQKRT